MIWSYIFTEPLVVAMNKGCHCFSTELTKSRESKGLVKWPDPEDHHCAPLTTKYLVKVNIF